MELMDLGVIRPVGIRVILPLRFPTETNRIVGWLTPLQAVKPAYTGDSLG